MKDMEYSYQLTVSNYLNKIGFNTLEDKDKFHPEKIDFYTIKPEKKICDLNISDFNTEDCKYTTIKRSKLIEFLKDRLDDDIIEYDHRIEKIEKNNDQIILNFNEIIKQFVTI